MLYTQQGMRIGSMRIDRLLAITIMLINRRMITARELSDHFGVSIRTIYRDFEAIVASGVPIISYPGVQGGFCIQENYRLSKQVLTLEDMASLLSTLQGINSTLKSTQLQNVTEKILNLVPDDKVSALHQLGNQLCISLQPWGFSEQHKERLRQLQQAISQNRCVSISYMDVKAAASQRTIEPMTLVFKGTGWYCFGFCRLRNDFRIFKLSRIQHLCLLDIQFIRKEKKYDDQAFEHVWQSHGIDLVLRFPAETHPFLLEYLEPGQISAQQDGFLIVRLSLPEDEWLYWWLFQFGHRVEVLEPPHIRLVLKERAEKIVGLYKP